MSGIRSLSALDPPASGTAQPEQAPGDEREAERGEDARRLRQLLQRSPAGTTAPGARPAMSAPSSMPVPARPNRPRSTGTKGGPDPAGAAKGFPAGVTGEAMPPSGARTGEAATGPIPRHPERKGASAEDTAQAGKPGSDADTAPAGDTRGLAPRRSRDDLDRTGGGPGGGFGGGSSQDQGGEPRGQPSPTGLLSDLAGDAMHPPQASTGAADAARANPGRRAEELATLINEITDRVLAGQRGGVPELRATLRGDPWGQTKLLITRSDNTLDVTILAGNASSQSLLSGNGSDLANRLAYKLDMAVLLRVTQEDTTGSGGGRDGQGDRRSRGLENLITYVAGG